MAFRIITGSMGGGKSYMGAELLLKYLDEGAWVHTNIDLVMEEVEARGYSERVVILSENPEEWQPLIYRAREGQENLVVIDEGMLKFDAHDWQVTKKKYKLLLEFMVWSRKFGLDVYLIGQAQKGMDVTFSRIALEVIACQAVKEFALVGPIMVTMRGDFRRKFKNANGTATGRVDWVRFRPEVGSFYRTESTHGKFEDQPIAIGRKPRNEVAVRRRSWAMLLTFVGILLAGFYGASKLLNRVLHRGQHPAKEVAAALPAAAAPRFVETPPVISTYSKPPVPEKEKLRVWCVADYGKVEFWEAYTGLRVAVGQVIDETEILAVEMSKRIFKARLADGRILAFRPSSRNDNPPPPNSGPATPSWNLPSLLPTSAFTSPSSP